ncbi:hypothetical protein TNCT_521041 [Trichonephila clavata]|uniref:Uncharacterized protein n=1 Tax=Trichonephila clavata TaxID=2740835 RepID=A0A8X6H633_TRICU|nr:hypothetical protein TNCT_521041 [Trichonephila clavata]
MSWSKGLLMSEGSADNGVKGEFKQASIWHNREDNFKIQNTGFTCLEQTIFRFESRFGARQIGFSDKRGPTKATPTLLNGRIGVILSVGNSLLSNTPFEDFAQDAFI